MKKLSLVLASMLILLSANVFAQGRGGNPEERAKKQLTHLKVMLDLSDQQYASIEGIMKSSMEEMKALREEGEKEREEMQKNAKLVKKAEAEDIKLVLTDEQKVKFEEMLKMKEERGNAENGRGRGKPKGGMGQH